jgi:hypothetical protein
MPADQDPQPPRPDAPRWSHVLWCAACGRTLACRADEVPAFARDGWPECCGHVMCFGPACDPTAGATPRGRTTRPARPRRCE